MQPRAILGMVAFRLEALSKWGQPGQGGSRSWPINRRTSFRQKRSAAVNRRAAAASGVAVNSPHAVPHEAGLKLLTAQLAPMDLSASALIRKAHGIPEWKLFVYK
jgi:hypothetical protein